MTINDTVPPEATEPAGTTSPPFRWRDPSQDGVSLSIHPAAELFPRLSEAELKDLADDIKINGLHVPIAVCKSDDGKTLAVVDGISRLDAMELTGLLHSGGDGNLRVGDDFVRFSAVTTDPYEAALSFNVRRRHLTPEQKRELLIKVIAAQPEKSDRQIAEMVKRDHKTVAVARKAGEDVGRIPHVEKRTDSKGRKQQAKKSKLVNPKKATVERDRQECIALDQKVRDAERKLAEWRADHPVVDDATSSAERRKAAYTSSYDLAKLKEAMAEVEVQAVAGNNTRLKEALRCLQREAGLALEADCVIAIPAVLQ
jgi:hypothetical protein